MPNACNVFNKLHAKLPTTACDKAYKLRVFQPAGCSLIYLQLTDEYTRGVIAVMPAISFIFACNCRFFCLQLRMFLAAITGFFACIADFFYLQIAYVSLAKADNFAC